MVLRESVDMIGFLFVPEHAFTVDPADAAKALGEDAKPVLEAAAKALEALPEWTTAAIDAALRETPDRGPRPEAEERVHPGPRRGDRPPHLTAAVRVDRAAGPGADAAPAGRGAERPEAPR